MNKHLSFFHNDRGATALYSSQIILNKKIVCRQNSLLAGKYLTIPNNILLVWIFLLFNFNFNIFHNSPAPHKLVKLFILLCDNLHLKYSEKLTLRKSTQLQSFTSIVEYKISSRGSRKGVYFEATTFWKGPKFRNISPTPLNLDDLKNLLTLFNKPLLRQFIFNDKEIKVKQTVLTYFSHKGKRTVKYFQLFDVWSLLM